MTSSIKDRILAGLDAAETIEFAKALVRIPSYTTDETAVARFLHDFFRREGLESELQEVDPGRFQTVARLRASGGGGRSLMLNGHIDIDPIPGGWNRDPWTPAIEGDRFYGAGVYNMKGGVAAMVMATVAARRAGVPLRGDVVVACVVGELQGGVGTVHLLKQGIRSDLAIVPEPYSTGNIITKHTGVMEFAVHVVGRTAHISRQELGINAISKMGKAVQALEAATLRGDRDPDLPALPRLNVGSIVGGRGRECELRGPNIVPDFCSVYVDVRFQQGLTVDSILRDVRGALDVVAAADRDFAYEIEFPMKPERRAFRELMVPVSMPTDHFLVQTLRKEVVSLIGREPTIGAVTPLSYAGNDTAHLYSAGIPCCLYGPGGGYDEGSAERWTSVEQIIGCSRVYGAMIAELCA